MRQALHIPFAFAIALLVLLASGVVYADDPTFDLTSFTENSGVNNPPPPWGNGQPIKNYFLSASGSFDVPAGYSSVSYSVFIDQTNPDGSTSRIFSQPASQPVANSGSGLARC